MLEEYIYRGKNRLRRGTGSVSVEIAYRCTDGKVFSVDKNRAAIKLTEVNRRKFRCDNIEITECEAEKAAEALPAADCVFIGGSGGQLEKIIKTSHQKNPRVKIVITAVSLETLKESIAVFDKIGIETEITQIAVTRTKKAGSHTMLSAENPVFIIKGAVFRLCPIKKSKSERILQRQEKTEHPTYAFTVMIQFMRDFPTCICGRT